MTRKIKWNKKELNSGKDSSGISNIDNISGKHQGISQGYQQGSLTKGLIAYYPMERGKGEIIRDAALNNTGQIIGAEWSSNSPMEGYSLDFDEEDRVEAGFLPEHNGSLTFAAWIYWKGYSGNTDGFWGHHHEGQNVHIEMRGTGSDDMRVAFDDNYDFRIDPPNEGEWTHFVLVYDHKQGEARVYFDNQLKHTENGGKIAEPWFKNPYADAMVFGESLSSSLDRGFPGLQKDIRIYYRKLSFPEIEALYNLSRPNGIIVDEGDVPGQSSGGVSRWRFDDDSDTDTVTDSWGDNDGVIEGALYTSQRVYGRNAMSFEGENEYIETSYYPSTQESTFGGWVKWDDISQNRAPFGVHDDNDRRLYLEYYEPSDGIRWGIGDTHATLDFTPEKGKWYFLMVTADGSEARLYINGVQRDSFSYSRDQQESSDSFIIGNRTFDGNLVENFHSGNVDEVRIYERALNSLEVEKLFKKGSYRINRSDTLQ